MCIIYRIQLGGGAVCNHASGIRNVFFFQLFVVLSKHKIQCCNGLLLQTFAGRLRDAAELKITHANRIDHNTVLLNSLETQLCTSVVINSNCTPSTNLKTSVKEPICLEMATLANLHHQPLQMGGGGGGGGGENVHNLRNSAGGGGWVCNHASGIIVVTQCGRYLTTSVGYFASCIYV